MLGGDPPGALFSALKRYLRMKAVQNVIRSEVRCQENPLTTSAV